MAEARIRRAAVGTSRDATSIPYSANASAWPLCDSRTPVGTDPGAGAVGGRAPAGRGGAGVDRPRVDGRRRVNGRAGHETARVVVGVEKALDPPPEGGIAAAGV